ARRAAAPPTRAGAAQRPTPRPATPHLQRAGARCSDTDDRADIAVYSRSVARNCAVASASRPSRDHLALGHTSARRAPGVTSAPPPRSPDDDPPTRATCWWPALPIPRGGRRPAGAAGPRLADLVFPVAQHHAGAGGRWLAA